MNNGNDEKLTLSDWVTFLSGESTPAIANVISLAAFLLAAFAMALATTLSTNDHSWIRTLDIAEFGILVILLFIAAIITIRRHAGKAEKLLRRIMREELKDPLQIQREWKGEKYTNQSERRDS